MESFHFNNVKAEKAEAMRRYNRQKKLKNFLFLVEVVAALALLSWSFYTYVPIVSQVTNNFLCQNVAVFSPSFHVFMIVNVLVLLIYFSSSQRPTKPDLYDEYVTTTAAAAAVAAVANTNKSVPHQSVNCVDDSREPEQPVVEKQIVYVDNAVTSPVRQNTKPSPTVRDFEKKKQVDVSPVGAVTESDKNYRRSRSERFVKDKRWELRRSETVVERKMVAVRKEPARRSSAIDDLSSEDFRLTIETFIASKKKTLIRENRLDLELERKECMAITLRACN